MVVLHLLLEWAVENMGAEQSIIYLSIPGILISLCMLLFLKNTDFQQEAPSQYHSSWKSLKEILKNQQIIWLAIAGALMVGPLESFADVFGEPYLVTVYHFSPRDAGYLTASAIYFGFCVGAPLLATIADRFNCHYIINIACGIGMTVAFHLMLEKVITGYTVMFICAFIIGIMSSYQVIVISTVADLVPPHLNGVAIAVVNMFNMTASMGFNAAIGSLLDHYWTGEIAHGKRIYSDIAYSDALYILPITLMFGAIIFFVLKPSRSN
jgi:fucose permease